MKNKNILFFLIALVVTGTVINSCKKEEDSKNIKPLFTNGSWQLSSVMVFNYVGSNGEKTDTLSTTCGSSQLFTFNSNGTCTYTNFNCQSTPHSGNWSLSDDGLVMFSNIILDSIPGGKNNQPFTYSKIINIGNYSMVLQTCDVATYFTATTKRKIVQFGFIHIAAK